MADRLAPPCTHREYGFDELLNYLSTKIRPVSLMSGGRKGQDNLLLPGGPGLA